MSSVPQGPGWWQASDGRWYPPESHPTNQPTAQQPPVFQQPVQQQPGYEQPPYQQLVSASSSKTGWIVAGVVLLVVVSLIGALIALVVVSDGSQTIAVGGQDNPVDTTIPVATRDDAPDATSDVTIVGGPGGDLQALLAAAIADIEAFWTAEMPDVYGQDYEPVAGGFYSSSPGEQPPPCTESLDEVAGNAFYCSTEDVIAWDDTGLIPDLLERHGELSVATVFAHERGHAIQARVGMDGATVTLEHQADCFAGAWVRHVEADGSEYFQIRGDALDQALGGFLEIADSPGTSARDPDAHGSAFDRINAFQDGYETGASSCAEYSDESINLVQFPFDTAEDAARGGDAPYDEILPLATSDLEDYWATVSDQVFNTTWTSLETPVGFDPDQGGPDCGGDPVKDLYLFYCVPDRYVGYDDAGLFPAVYEGGDFAVATLFGTQYALAAQDQLGIAPEDVLEQNLLADCMTGSWAASVFLGERPKETNMSLSPGDLDEAVGVLLAFGDGSAGSEQGTGFARVASYRKGVLGGIKGCTGQ